MDVANLFAVSISFAPRWWSVEALSIIFFNVNDKHSMGLASHMIKFVHVVIFELFKDKS